MRYCPQCGTPLMAGAKFCAECGRPLSGLASGAGPDSFSRRAGDSVLRSQSPVTMAFVGVFVAITIFGLAAAAWIYLKTPEVVREQIASAPPASAPAAGEPAAAPQQGEAASAPAAGGTGSGGLPPGHPHVELPTEARTFIDKIEKDARANPKDIPAWNKFGAVAMRAAMFDQNYYAKAEEAYGHVLKLDPDDLEALRGAGDIDYDKQRYDEAIAAYEHYLKKKPDDPQVRTDLGTMYLYTGNADQAVVQYKKALAVKPDFFQAYYNMGAAYAQQNKLEDADAALNKALKLAPDESTKTQVKNLIAKLTAPTVPQMPSIQMPPSPTASPAAGVSGAAAASPAAQASPAATDFHGAIEQKIRALPIAGQKVSAVQWPDNLKAKVLMDNFPMDQMPPMMKDKFLSDIKSGIDTAKKDHQVTSKVEVDLVDSASGRVMATVSE